MYIDSNIFIYASIDKKNKGKNCRRIIKAINEQQVNTASSYLTVDEVLWILKKHIGRKDALTIIKTMLSLPIKWIELNNSVIIRMTSQFEKTNLDSRDTLHLSSMKELSLSTIVSEDTDFDNIKGIKRINSSEFIKKYL